MTYNLYSILTDKAGHWELEESHELANRYDIHDHRGVLTPLEAWSPTPHAIMKRDPSVTDSLLAQGAASIGGNLVQTSTADYVTAALRAQSCILNNPGTTLLTIKAGNLNIPRALPSVAGSGETTSVTLLGKPTFENLVLTAQPYHASLVVSNTLIRQASDRSVSDFLKMELLRAVSTLIDNMAIVGQGSTFNQALGILNLPTQAVGLSDPGSVVTYTFGATANWSKIQTAISALDYANYEDKNDNRVWLISPATRTKLANAQAVSGGSFFIYDHQTHRIAGYRALTSNQLSGTNQVIFLDSSEAVVVMHGAIDILANPYTYMASDATGIDVGIYASFGLKRCGASVSSDAGNQ